MRDAVSHKTNRHPAHLPNERNIMAATFTGSALPAIPFGTMRAALRKIDYHIAFKLLGGSSMADDAPTAVPVPKRVAPISCPSDAAL